MKRCSDRVLEHVDVVLNLFVGVQLVSSVVSCCAFRLVTHVRFVHIVSPLVIISIAAGRKLLVAELIVATIGLLPIVHPYVLLKVPSLVEHFTALLLAHWINPFAAKWRPFPRYRSHLRIFNYKIYNKFCD